MATLSIRSHRLLRLVALWILFSILGLHFVTVFQKMFTYSVNNKDYNHIKDSQTLKPLLEPKRTMHCPNPVIIQDPKKAIINEISKNKTTMDCRVNLNAGTKIYITLYYIIFIYIYTCKVQVILTKYEGNQLSKSQYTSIMTSNLISIDSQLYQAIS